MRTWPIVVATVWVTAGLAMAAPSDRADPAKVDAKVMAVCQKCHGQTGDSISPLYPRLNGQQADYITAQLKAFRSRGRDDTHARNYMWSVARGLDDTMIVALGQHYANQKPTPQQSGGALAAEGENLYRSGDGARGIIPCQQCHGKSGEGMGAFPRITGQHAAYLRMVLGAFRSGLRKSDIMNPAAKNLTDREIEALSSYLAND